MGLVGAVYAICTVVGPLMGGAFAGNPVTSSIKRY